MANIFPDGFEEMNENERQDWFNDLSFNGLRELCKISINECLETKEQLAEATLQVNSLLQANEDLLQGINQLLDRNMVLFYQCFFGDFSYKIGFILRFLSLPIVLLFLL